MLKLWWVVNSITLNMGKNVFKFTELTYSCILFLVQNIPILIKYNLYQGKDMPRYNIKLLIGHSTGMEVI